jgi:hypothetical protein
VVELAITADAKKYLDQKAARDPLNIIIYRDLDLGTCKCAGTGFKFVSKVKVSRKEPDTMFAIMGSVDGLPVWVEKALFPEIQNGFERGKLKLKKGLLGLKLESE